MFTFTPVFFVHGESFKYIITHISRIQIILLFIITELIKYIFYIKEIKFQNICFIYNFSKSKSEN